MGTKKVTLPNMKNFDLSSLDKSYRPYAVMDTYSPGGNWIEEQRFNRHRQGTESGRILYGNWQEEEALATEREANANSSRMHSSHSNRSRHGRHDSTDQQLSLNPPLEGTNRVTFSPDHTARLEVEMDKVWQPIRNRGNGHYTGGFNSCPGILQDQRHPELRLFETTTASDYVAHPINIRAGRGPGFGVRRALLLQRCLREAKEINAQEEEKRRRAQALEESSAWLAKNRSGANFTRPLITRIEQDYLAEEPITVYTGLPGSDRGPMVVPGTTPIAPMAASRFSRHTYFSDPKYQL